MVLVGTTIIAGYIKYQQEIFELCYNKNMSRKVRTKLCKECGKEIRSSFPKVFCDSSCAAKFNNKARKENGWRRTQE